MNSFYEAHLRYKAQQQQRDNLERLANAWLENQLKKVHGGYLSEISREAHATGKVIDHSKEEHNV